MTADNQKPTTENVDNEPIERETANDSMSDSTEHSEGSIDSNQEDFPYVPPREIDRHFKWKRRRETWVPIMTVIVSVAALIIIGYQAYIYDHQRKIMDKQLDLTQQNLRITERAYVGVASLNADLVRCQVVIMLENLGRKPAKTITMTTHAYRVSTRLDGAKKEFNAGDVRLFPGSLKMRVVIPMRKCNPEEIKAINEQRQFLYVDGVIQYDDGFGFSDSTSFAYEYIPPPAEGWQAVSTPVAQMAQSLERRAFDLALNNPLRTAIPSTEQTPFLRRVPYTPSPLTGSPNLGTPIPQVSPLMTPSPKENNSSLAGGPNLAAPRPQVSPLRTPSSQGSSCGCSCAITCGNVCMFDCVGCGLVEGTEQAQRCCAEAAKAAGDVGPCIPKN